MFGSAIPSWKNRFGNDLPKSIVLIDSVVSAPTTTTFGLRRPRSMSALPKYNRWLSIFQGRRSNRGLLRVELRQGELQLFVACRGPVILDLVLHERDALALHRAGEDRGGLPFRPVGFLDRGEDLAEVVSIDCQDMPVERLPFLRERLEGHDVLRSTLLLDSVPADERRQVVEAVLRRGHRGLPRLPDVLLAVAEDAVHPPGLVIHARREREADREREPF